MSTSGRGAAPVQAGFVFGPVGTGEGEVRNGSEMTFIVETRPSKDYYKPRFVQM
jgi:hypothetical protein